MKEKKMGKNVGFSVRGFLLRVGPARVVRSRAQTGQAATRTPTNQLPYLQLPPTTLLLFLALHPSPVACYYLFVASRLSKADLLLSHRNTRLPLPHHDLPPALRTVMATNHHAHGPLSGQRIRSESLLLPLSPACDAMEPQTQGEERARGRKVRQDDPLLWRRSRSLRATQRLCPPNRLNQGPDPFPRQRGCRSVRRGTGCRRGLGLLFR